MMMMNMPDFLNALRVARVRWPEIPKKSFHQAAATWSKDFKSMKCCPDMLARWAEFYTLKASA